MKVIVRSTKEYRKEAEEQGQQDFIERQIEMARQSGNLNFGTLIRADDRYVKLNCTSNLRCIMTYEDFSAFGEKIRCYVALRLVTHDKYDKFCNYKDASEQASFSRIRDIDWDEIKQSLEDNFSEIETAIDFKPLTQGESAFINQSSELLSEFVSFPVYESDYWMSAAQGLSDTEMAVLRNAICGWMSEHQSKTYELGRFSVSGVGKIVLLAFYRIAGSRNLFLLHFGNPEEIEDFVSKNLPGECEPSFDGLLRLCVRAYPYSLILSDAALWLQKERSSATNFMLSSRERDLFSKKPVYPLCLSGRAGSGKSTLLRYLFADCLFCYQASGSDLLPPLFISHSKHHAEKAQKVCKTLFANDFRNSRSLIDSGIDYESSLRPLLDNSCRSFASFAQECAKKISDADDDENSWKKYVREQPMSFKKFCNLWNQKFKGIAGAAENYGPELSWHVIRTFIKGWNADYILGIDEFSQIGDDNHPYVTETDFKNVYENVWGWYSKLLADSGMWDDQDLIRYCLGSMSSQSEMFSALYCDEIQDFTRIEREFLFQCSSFSRRKILNEAEFEKIPFVFAGDEIQSVNLTGFSWAGLRSHLAEAFSNQTSCRSFEIKPSEPVELTDNFRSAPAIVRLANRIHLLRLSRTGGSASSPQRPHAFSVNASETVCCLDPNNDEVWKNLKDTNAVVIVPCPDGENLSTYIKSSPVRDKIDFDANGNAKDLTIISARDAKDVQYPCVALYGFEMKSGALGLDALLDWFRHPTDDPCQDIAVRRMLTAAYVSATRAQRQLYILSDCWKSDSIWSGLFNDYSAARSQKLGELDSRMLEKAKWPREPGVLGYIAEGEPDCIGRHGISCSPEQARAIEADALLAQDKGGLRRAVSMYARLGMYADKDRCAAYDLRLSDRHLQAARAFAALGMDKEALDEYWEELSDNPEPLLFGEIAKLSCPDSIECEFAKEAASERCSNINVCRLLEKFIESWGNPQRRYSLKERSAAWHAVFGAIFKNVSKSCSRAETEPASLNKDSVMGDFERVASDKTDAACLCRLVRQLHVLTEDAFELDLAEVAKIASGSDCDEETAAIWELSANLAAERPAEYYLAKCRLLPYPDNLVYRKHTGEGWCDAVIKDCYEYDGGFLPGCVQESCETFEMQSSGGDDFACGRSYDIDSLNEQQRKIIGEAFFERGSEVNEQKYGLSMLLECAKSKPESEELTRKAVERKNMCLPKCMASLFSYRFAGRPEKLNPEKFFDEELADLANSMNRILAWREKNFADSLNRDINAAFAIKDVFIGTFGDCLKSAWSGLLLYEAGRIMESRKDFLSAWHFYEWAVESTESAADPILDRYLKRRLVYCLETASYSQNAFISDMYAVAEKRRTELGISADEKISPETEYPGWQMLYFEVIGRDPSINKNYHTSKICKGTYVSKKRNVRKYKGHQNELISEKAIALAQKLNSRRKDPEHIALQKQKEERMKEQAELDAQSPDKKNLAIFAEPCRKENELQEEHDLQNHESSGMSKRKKKDRAASNGFAYPGMLRARRFIPMTGKPSVAVSLGSSFLGKALPLTAASINDAASKEDEAARDNPTNEAMANRDPDSENLNCLNAARGGADNANASIELSASVDDKSEHTGANNESAAAETVAGAQAQNSEESKNSEAAPKAEEDKKAEEAKREEARKEELRKRREKEEADRQKREAARAEKKRKKQEQKKEAEEKRLRKEEAKKIRQELKKTQKLECAQNAEQLAAEEEIRKQQEAEELAARVRKVEEARRENEEHAAKLRAEREREVQERAEQAKAEQARIAAEKKIAAEQAELQKENESQSCADASAMATASMGNQQSAQASYDQHLSLPADASKTEEVAQAGGSQIAGKEVTAANGKSEPSDAMPVVGENGRGGQKVDDGRNGSAHTNQFSAYATKSNIAENDANRSKKIFEMDIEGYKLRYHPQTGELSVLYVSDEADLFFKMKRGDEVSGKDFLIGADDTLIRADTGESTPFRVGCTFDSVCVTLRASGVQLYFPYEYQGDLA